MRLMAQWLAGAFAPGWPERAIHLIAIGLLIALALLVAFALAEETSLRGRARAVTRSWARAAAEATTVEARGDVLIARTTTEQTAICLLKTVIGEHR